MHHNIFIRCSILLLGLMMAAFAAERCVVAEFAYSEG